MDRLDSFPTLQRGRSGPGDYYPSTAQHARDATTLSMDTIDKDLNNSSFSILDGCDLCIKCNKRSCESQNHEFAGGKRDFSRLFSCKARVQLKPSLGSV